jgi:hypothetical protein
MHYQVLFPTNPVLTTLRKILAGHKTRRFIAFSSPKWQQHTATHHYFYKKRTVRPSDIT